METLLALGAGAAALTAIGIAGRKAVNSMRTFFTLQSVAARLINAEMRTNSGGSLLDKVNKISINHHIAEKHWIELGEKQEEIKRALVLMTFTSDQRLIKLEKAVSEYGSIPCLRLAELEQVVKTMKEDTP